jgi:hypothetical protein
VEKILYFEQVKYVNYGIINGMTRSTTTTSEGESARSLKWIFGASSDVEYLRSITPDSLWDAVYTKFRYSFGKACRAHGINLPWYLPLSIGGLGLPLPCGKSFTREDRAYAFKVCSSFKIYRKINSLRCKFKGIWDTMGWVLDQYECNKADLVVGWKSDLTSVVDKLNPRFLLFNPYVDNADGMAVSRDVMIRGRDVLSSLRAQIMAARMGRLYGRLKGGSVPTEIQFGNLELSHMPLVSLLPQ